MRPIWAVVPLKEIDAAKQRLAPALAPALRRDLALAMFEDVLEALAAVAELSGIVVATPDRDAAVLARRYGARVSHENARHGHSAAVMDAARALAREGAAMLTVPADIPLLRPSDVRRLVAARAGEPHFVIVPSRDRRGTNAVLTSPADAVTLRFGDDSFCNHLAAARALGLEPRIVELPRVALDIDHAGDLAALRAADGGTRAHRVLADRGLAAGLETEARA